MTLKLDSVVDCNSIKRPSGVVSEVTMIGNIVKNLNNPTSHNNQKVFRYIKAFLLDLIRSISEFVEFLLPLLNLENELKILKSLESKNNRLKMLILRDLVPIHVTFNEDSTPNLLV